MGKFFAELKRRHVYRVAAAYAVVAWVLIQLIGNVSPMLRLPDWAGTLVLVLLLAGFPVALLFCWIQQLPRTESAGPAKSAAVDWILSGALAVVIGLILYQQLTPSSSTGDRVIRPEQANSASAPIDAAGIAIAVLPFTNLSGDAAQEFFSDGITEEINAALTKVPDLHVVARMSAFEFKGQSGNVREVGQALSATHLIEGSVRKAGNRLRITAQLVRADSGLNLWSENYDRELTDIFAIQEDIAKAIAGALRVPLGLARGDTLVRSRTSNSNTYEDYLRAKALVRGRLGSNGLQQLTEGITLLQQVTTRDPNYAPAWALLATAHALIPVFHPSVSGGTIEEMRAIVDENLAKAEAAAARATQLDSRNADGYIAMGVVQASRGKWVAAQDLFSRALMLDGDNPDALHFYSGILSDLGYLSQATMMRQRLQVLDPFVPVINSVSARIFWVTGQRDAAEVLLRKIPDFSAGAGLLRSRIYAAEGRYGEAADALRQTDSITPAPMRERAANILRSAPTTTTSFPRLGPYSFVYLYTGAADHALDRYNEYPSAGFFPGTQIVYLWERAYADLRKTERFKAFVRNAGIFDFWRAKGPPDFCRSLGAADFVCM